MPKVYFCSKVICDVSNDEEDYEGLEPCEDYTHYPWDGNFFVIVPDDILQIYDEDSIDIYLAERLSDETGYCIQTFKFEECDEDETARVLAADEEYDEAELLKQDNEDLQRIMDMTLPYRHKEWDDLLYLYYLKNIHGKDIEAIDIKLALKVDGSLFIDDAVDDDWEADPETLVVEVTGGY